MLRAVGTKKQKLLYIDNSRLTSLAIVWSKIVQIIEQMKQIWRISPSKWPRCISLLSALFSILSHFLRVANTSIRDDIGRFAFWTV